VKVLLVAMYFPPAGGAGVQRPLKLAGHLADLGFDVHVVAPDDPKWIYRDPSLRVPDALTVHRVKNAGPKVRYRDALRNAGLLESLGARAAIQFRRVLVPDASVIWSLTAAATVRRLVPRLGIDVVLTTSPPISVHLAGLAGQKAGARWVADLRDSFLSPDRRRHVRGEARLQRLVARRADAITAATDGFAAEMRALQPRGPVEVIENGSDFEDFAGLEYHPSQERFRLTHTGSFASRRDARPFYEALARVDGSVVARFVGGFRAADEPLVEELGIRDKLEVVPFQPHEDVVRLQRDSEALLLLIPEADGRGRGVLSGKVFEYVSVRRPILAAVPPHGAAAELIREIGAGVIAPPDDPRAIRAALEELHARWRDGGLPDVQLSADWRRRLSRRTRVEEMAALLHDVVAS
jgi:glycosyltransferase involved in cell wall biosynthesis